MQNELSLVFMSEKEGAVAESVFKICEMQGAVVFQKTGVMSDKWDVSALKGLYLYTVLGVHSEMLATGKVMIKNP